MQEIIEYYGIALLEMMAVVFIIGVFLKCCQQGGVISDVVEVFLYTLWN